MDKSTQSQELEVAEKAPPIGEVYNLSGLVEGTAEVASPFSPGDTKEVHVLLGDCVPGSDIEYPSPRHVLRRDYREQFKVGELTWFVGGSEPPERTPVQGGAGQGLSYGHGRPASAGSRGGRSDTVGRLSPLAAAVAGGLAAVGFVLLGLAFVDSGAPALSLALLIAVFTTVASVAVWRAGAMSRSPRLSEREDGDGWSELWALRVGAGIREAIAVGLRTGGLGLLVQPRDPAEDGTEIDEAEEAPGEVR